MSVAVWVIPACLLSIASSGGSWVESYRRAERLRQEGAYAAAEAEYHAARRQGQQGGDPCPALALIDTELAVLEQKLNRLGEAENRAAEAMKVWDGCPSPHPQETAATLRILAAIRTDQGRYPDALTLLQQALDILPAGPVNGAWRAEITSRLGVVYFLEGKVQEAESAYRLALELNQAATVPDTLVQVSILDNLGMLYYTRAAYDEAGKCYESALQLGEQPGLHRPELDDTRIHLARLYSVRGLWTQAEALFRAVLASSEKQLGNAHPQVLTLKNDLGVLYWSEGKRREAEAVFRRALAAWQQSGGPHTISSAALLLNWGGLVEEQGHWAEAGKSYRQALSTLKDTGPAGASYMGTVWNSLGRVEYHRRDYAIAAESFRKAVEIWDESLGAGHPRSASALHNLAVVEIAQRRFSDAEGHLRTALDIWDHDTESQLNSGRAAALRDYALLLKRDGRSREATDLEGRAAALEARIRERQRLARMSVDVRELQAER